MPASQPNRALVELGFKQTRKWMSAHPNNPVKVKHMFGRRD
jgi:hypothetical protein